MAHTITLQAFASADANRADRGAMHGIRMNVVTSAIVAALRGNATQWLAALPVGNGKGQIAKAYKAGFAAVGLIQKHAYTGKLTAEVSAEIDTRAAEVAQVFSVAFCEVLPLTTAEKSDEAKAEAKAKREAARNAESLAYAASMGYVKADTVAATTGNLSPAALVDVCVAAIDAGTIAGENLIALTKACNAATKAAKAAAKAAETAAA